MTEHSLIMTTTGDRAEADDIARAVVEAGFVACAQIMPIHSVYRWQGKLEGGDEFLVLLKTRAARVAETMALVKERHAYETPEIITLPITDGSPAYLGWIDQQTR